jgi:signal transduction histidine kinase
MNSEHNDRADDIAHDVAAVGRIAAVPTLLRVLCDSTGMGFAAVARVSEGSWTACAVQDDIQFGLKPGGQLDVHTTLCKEVRSARAPVFIDQASDDPVYCNHHTPRIYSIESYASVPIILGDGSYFGNLCAIDPRPAKVSDPRVKSMFARFADLIGQQLDSERRQERTHAALLDEQAAGELREQFMAILGHDLRNPLSAVSACSQLLERKAKDPDIANLAARITTNTKRMSRLIDDILDFTRLRLGGEMGLDFETVPDLETALAAVVAEISDAHPGRVIRCEIAIGRPVMGDRGRLQQLASNLLANAVAHGAPDQPVEFDARIVGNRLTIEVANRGEPIPAAHLGEVFRPFWRRSGPRGRDGLGLGLHICDQIAKAHGGRIDVTSTSGDGTRFIASLPIVEVGAASN